MNKPQVTVIMPFFNSVKFIREAIDSILAQTYTDWELMLIDDGSTDGSTMIAQEFAANFPEKIKYLHHEGHRNLGTSATNNLGVRNSRGKYIAFLDSDDIALPHKLQEQVPLMDSQSEAAMICGRTIYWSGWTGNPDDIAMDNVVGLGVPENRLFQPPSLFIPFFLTKEAETPCTCSILVRREVFDRVGGFEESFRKIYTDQGFYTKVVLECPIYVSSKTWAKYRQHDDSCCYVVARRGEEGLARLRFLLWLENFLNKKNVIDPAIRQALDNALAEARIKTRT